MINIEDNTNVALYTGPGAELVKDVEKVMQDRIPYRKINASEVRYGVLENFKLLIMPGGYTARYIPNLKPKGCEAIKNFINKKGGRYLGICAGAYIAGPDKLGISKSKMVRESGIFTCETTIQDPIHPIFEGQKKSTLMVFYQNGPHIRPHQGEKLLALYADGTTSLIECRNALIFSWHPEKLPHTVPILLKSIEYLIH